MKIIPKLTMLVGLPASGKSTYAKIFAKTSNAVIHSSDALREEIFDNEEEQTKNDELFKELHKRIKQDLRKGIDVIYDATNINYKRRMNFLNELKNIPCLKTCIVIVTSYEDCLIQNKKRERQVPEEVIKRMYLNFYVPQFYEGWQNISFHYTYDYIWDMEKLMNELENIPHDNPNHSLNIGTHCLKTSELVFYSLCKKYKWDAFQANIMDNKISFILGNAALLHDIGKEFTKSFINSKGEKTDIAHYYNHNNVSAYLSLIYNNVFPSLDILEISNYIQWHMQPFFLTTQKSQEKFIKLVGQEFWENLLLIHKADLTAH